MSPGAPWASPTLTALMLRPSEVNFFKYPARDFVELLVTKMSRLPCNFADEVQPMCLSRSTVCIACMVFLVCHPTPSQLANAGSTAAV